jgi:hypothetical protein
MFYRTYICCQQVYPIVPTLLIHKLDSQVLAIHYVNILNTKPCSLVYLTSLWTYGHLKLLPLLRLGYSRYL